MEQENELNDSFELLGYKIKLKSDNHTILEQKIAPEQIVSCVRQKVNTYVDKNPQMDKTKIILLVALEFAESNLNLKHELNEIIDFTSSEMKQVLESIDAVLNNGNGDNNLLKDDNQFTKVQ